MIKHVPDRFVTAEKIKRSKDKEWLRFYKQRMFKIKRLCDIKVFE